MDFRQAIQPSSRDTAADAPSEKDSKSSAKAADKPTPSGDDGHQGGKWLSVLNVVVLFGVAALVVAITLVFSRSGGTHEYKFVDNTKYQAVFLNNGQVYFGKVTSLNDQFVRLANIYYLTQASASGTASAPTDANSNYTLVKLGCQQIHDPYDQMVINRSQVTFWENLQDDGKVVKSINAFIKQNPKGPDCTQVSTQTQATGTGTGAAATDSTTGAATTKTPAKQ